MQNSLRLAHSAPSHNARPHLTAVGRAQPRNRAGGAAQPSLLQAFAKHVAQRPDRLVAQCGSETLTYAELDAKSDELARSLVGLGVGPDVLVGIRLSRSLHLPVAMLATLKAGGAYLPIDPSHPAERTQLVLDIARPAVLIEQSGPDGQPVAHAAESGVHTLGTSPAPHAPAAPFDLPEATPDQLAYVIFTSGSTGKPKGVELTRANLDSYLHAMAQEPGLRADECCLALATVAFDMSVFDFWLPLYLGKSFVIAEDGLSRDVLRLKARLEVGDITFLHATPTTLSMLIEAGWQGRPDLRVLSGGEALTAELSQAILERAGELYNGYGPTEGTVCATLWKVVPDQPISIGTPVAGMHTYVLDAQQSPVADGTEGELWIAGPGIARGYRDRPDLTRERFVPDPFTRKSGQRMYRTGDLVRRDASGKLFFVSRVDDQVKLRGHRIELGEIESVLAQHADVSSAIVTLHRDASTGVQQLAAYYTGSREVLPLELKQHAARSLPEYMLPCSFDRIETLPRTPSGKLDRKALPAPFGFVRATTGDDDSLRGDLEQVVAAAFSAVLGRAEILPSDDFFALGGSSLLALRFQAALEARTGEPFTLSQLFEGRTVRGIAKAMEQDGQGGAAVYALTEEGEGAPVFCLLGVYHYQPLADALRDVGRGFYGVYVPAEAALFDWAPWSRSKTKTLSSLAAQYIEAIRRRKPHGPYCLMGHSTGGVLAFEVARQLTEAGEEVEQVILLDSVLSTGVHRNAQQWARHVAHRAKRLWGALRFGAEAKLLERLSPRWPQLEARRERVREELAPIHHVLGFEAAEAHWERHLARPYAGSAVFIHAFGRSEPIGRVEATAGWGAWVEGPLSIGAVAGGHAEMMRKPNVQHVAQLLRPRLAVASKGQA